MISWKILARMPCAHAYSKSMIYFSAFLILFGVALANTLFVSFTSTIHGLSIVSQFISWTLLREYKYSRNFVDKLHFTNGYSIFYSVNTDHSCYFYKEISFKVAVYLFCVGNCFAVVFHQPRGNVFTAVFI